MPFVNLSKCTSGSILKGVFKILYLSFSFYIYIYIYIYMKLWKDLIKRSLKR